MVFLDFETQSLRNLFASGGRKYAQDPTTRIAICAFVTESRKTMWVLPWVPEEVKAPWEIHRDLAPPPWVLEAISNDEPLCAHNAFEFDAHVWNAKVQVPATWHDTLPLCRAAGLPASLDTVSKILFNRGKHPGKDIVKVLCQAQVRMGCVVYPQATVSAWNTLIEYCCDDALLLQALWDQVAWAQEPDVLRVHQSINDRGIPVDTAFAARLVLLQEELMQKRAHEFAEITDLDPQDVRSTTKVKEWLLNLGIRLPMVNGKVTLNKNELARLFKEPDAFFDGPDEDLAAAVTALKCRQEACRATGGKALAIIKATDPDGRARGQFVYYGAHTGRWSGRQMQPHNFPKGVKKIDVEKLSTTDLTIEMVDAAAAAAGCSASDILGTLLRGAIAAPALSVVDYAAIEARGVAWTCGEEKDLSIFNQWDADPYIPLASQIFERPITREDETERFVGKGAILGCGYGMGWRKFILWCKMYGVDIEKIISAERVVKLYRDSHPKIVAGWRMLQDAAHVVVTGGASEALACKCRLKMRGKDMLIVLPSGRPIVYRNARIEPRVPGYAKLFGARVFEVPTFIFDHPHGYEGMSYGGKFMENVVQGECRDIMADALVRCDKQQLPVPLHVHDEIGAETEALPDLCRLMSQAPDWAPNFPVAVEGYSWNRYTKLPPKSAQKCAGLKGSVR